MEAWTRFRDALARVVAPADTTVLSRVVSTWKHGRPLPLPNNYAEFGSIYRKSEILAACVWEIATSASEPELQAVIIDGKGTAKPLGTADRFAQLLARPNPEMGPFQLLERLFTHQQVAGQWYLHKVRSRKGLVVELWPLRPDRMRIVPGADGRILHFQFTHDGGKKTDLEPTDVIHCPLHPDFLDDFYGLAPFATAARIADLDNEAIDYLRAFFSNAGQPAGMLKFKSMKAPADRQRARDLWRERYGRASSGDKNWHDVAVLDDDVEYQELGSRPGKLGMKEIFDETESRMCLAFGIPPMIIGARMGADFATLANFDAAERRFWKDTLSPLYKRTGDALTAGLAPEFGESKAVRFDLSKVSALTEDLNDRRLFALSGYQGGLLTLDQALDLAGMPQIGGDDGQRRRDLSTPAGSNTSLAALTAFASVRRREHQAASPRAQAEKRMKDLMAKHFRAQGTALAEFIEDQIKEHTK